MARRKKNSEINVFSTSAIDLFASGMGVFLILVVISLPTITNKSTEDPTINQDTEQIEVELKKLAEVKSDFLQALLDQTKGLKDVETQVRKLAAEAKSARTKVEGLQNVAQTLQATQSVVKDMVQRIRVVDQREQEIIRKLKVEKRKVERITQMAKAMKKEINKLKGKIESNKKFVAVLLRWDSANHDLDLIIKDPKGRSFSFKERGTQLTIIDARKGPGTELWMLQDPMPGQYEIRVDYHGSYGNQEAPKALISILDRNQAQMLAPLTLSSEGASLSASKFVVNQKQEVEPLDKKYILRAPASN